MRKIFFVSILLITCYGFGYSQNVVNINDPHGKKHDEYFGAKSDDLALKEAKRYRKLNLNPKLQDLNLISLNDTIVLDLFEDRQYKAIIVRIKNSVNGALVIRAKLLKFSYSYCIISTYDHKSLITVDIPEKGEVYKIRYDYKSSNYYLLEIDKLKLNMNEDGPVKIFPKEITKTRKLIKDNITYGGLKLYNQDIIIDSKNGYEAFNTKGEQDGTIISLLVVYTPAAASWAVSNETNINDVIDNMIDKTELAFTNSNISLTIQNVHSEQIAYVEQNPDADLNNLTYNNDGYMDNVHYLRDVHCADLVLLLVADLGIYNGVSWGLNSGSGNPDAGFSIVDVKIASTLLTGIHEIGHNLGCGHHLLQLNNPGPGLSNYSAGWSWVGNSTNYFCSIMTYEGFTFGDGNYYNRVAYFSNPNIQYDGMPTGDQDNGDNARTVRETKTIVASYRNIYDINNDDLFINKTGKVQILFTVPENNEYYIGIWDKNGLWTPNWDFSPDYTPLSPNIGSNPLNYNIGQEHVVEFNVMPDTEEETFQF